MIDSRWCSSGDFDFIWFHCSRAARRLGPFGAKADERHALHDILTSTPHLTDLLAAGPRTMIADKNYYGRDFERELSDADIIILRPAIAPVLAGVLDPRGVWAIGARSLAESM